MTRGRQRSGNRKEGHRGVESLLKQMELKVDSDEPVHEDGAHLRRDLILAAEVVRLDPLCPLDLS